MKPCEPAALLPLPLPLPLLLANSRQRLGTARCPKGPWDLTTLRSIGSTGEKRGRCAGHGRQCSRGRQSRRCRIHTEYMCCAACCASAGRYSVRNMWPRPTDPWLQQFAFAGSTVTSWYLTADEHGCRFRAMAFSSAQYLRILVLGGHRCVYRIGCYLTTTTTVIVRCTSAVCLEPSRLIIARANVILNGPENEM